MISTGHIANLLLLVGLIGVFLSTRWAFTVLLFGALGMVLGAW